MLTIKFKESIMNVKWIARGVLLVLVTCSPAASQEITKGNVATRYDRFEDLTLVTADNMQVAEDKGLSSL